MVFKSSCAQHSTGVTSESCVSQPLDDVHASTSSDRLFDRRLSSDESSGRYIVTNCVFKNFAFACMRHATCGDVHCSLLIKVDVATKTNARGVASRLASQYPDANHILFHSRGCLSCLGCRPTTVHHTTTAKRSHATYCLRRGPRVASCHQVTRCYAG
jgi:hypothetical protein